MCLCVDGCKADTCIYSIDQPAVSSRSYSPLLNLIEDSACYVDEVKWPDPDRRSTLSLTVLYTDSFCLPLCFNFTVIIFVSVSNILE